MRPSLPLALLAFIFSLSSSAQNEYFSNNATWGMEHGTVEQWSANFVKVRYYPQGDTLINATLYKKLYEDGISVSYDYVTPNDPPGTVNFYDESPYNNPNPIGFFRSANEKIFRWNDSTLSEELMYDFDVEIGDTMHVSESIFYGTLIVSDVDSMLIGGEYRKLITASTETEQLISNYFVEGVGNLAAGLTGLAYPNVSDIADFLLCYTYNGENFDVYSSGFQELSPVDFACEFVVGLEENNSPRSFSVYPNPCDQNFHISNSISNLGTPFSLLDATGKLIFQKTIYQLNESVKIDHLADGLYFLEINGEVQKVQIVR